MTSSCWSVLLPSRPSAKPDKAPLLSQSEKEPVRQPSPAIRGGHDTTAKLAALRHVMQNERLDFYVVPTADAHGSEYVGDCDKRREWLTGFTGSAGVALVTSSKAYLFTDSRYHIQAEKQLDANWTLMKVGLAGVPGWAAFLATEVAGATVGIDPTLLDYGTAKALLAGLAPKGVSLVLPAANLVDAVWVDRPTRSRKEIVCHSLEFAGQSASDKIAALRTFLASQSQSSLSDPFAATPSYLLTTLPAIAWLLNLRGSDITFTPVFYAYVLVTMDEVVLWVQDGTAGDEVREAVREIGGRVESYDGVWKEWESREGTVFASSTISWALVQAIGEDNLSIVRSPVEAAQAIKNPVEIEGSRRAYLRDGVAWVRWAAWLDERMRKGDEVSEWVAGETLTTYRKKGEHFAGLAYDNISATNENAALPHYAPERVGSRIIDRETPYLNDSGAQYLDGTIDTTRTVHFGRPSAAQRRAFTRVLQGHIAIDSLVFPEGTTGVQIDVLARRALWADGMNYMHGTGHGVGEYLSVHEGPQGIGNYPTPLAPGHVQSNEPAYYEIGSFGIRIESVVGVKAVSTRRGFGDKRASRRCV